MNYQLMLQTIAMLCGMTALVLIFVVGYLMEIKSNNGAKLALTVAVLWFITLISGALAAGLS